MGHNLQALGTASLDTMGGMITLADPRDVPEGASPRCWDVDFNVGSVMSRPGLASVYTYATTLLITGFDLHYGIATFTYVGPEPTVNEGFVLSGFTGNQTYLNGMEVIVEDFTMTTFTALINHSDDGPITGINASAVSTTGLFSGPNIGSVFTSSSWSNPSNISSPTGYASVVSGTSDTAGPAAPTTVAVKYVGAASWSNPSNLVATGAPVATVSLSSNISSTLISNGTTFNVPAGATITGITVQVNGKYVGSGTGVVALQLATNGTPVGTQNTFALNSTTTPYTRGSSSFTWGTSFTPDTVNGTALGVLLTGSSNGAGTMSLNNLVVTVYYTLAVASETLLDQGFAFAISLTSGISGFGMSFKAYSSAATSASFQLLVNGVPTGDIKTVTLTTTPTVYQLGGAGDPWGYVWSPANVNSTLFGVQIVANGIGQTFVGDLDILTYIIPALENFNWIGSYQQNNELLTTLALDAAGNLWREDATNNPGVFSLALSGLLPGSFANGATIGNSEFIMFSDLSIGTERPRQLYSDGNFYPVTQVGPGAAPSFSASIGSVAGLITLSSFTQTGSVATFQYTPPGSEPSAGNVLVLSVPGTFLDGQVVTVLSTGLSSTQFEAEVTGSGTPGPIVGTATPTFSYDIASITQYPIYSGIDPAGLIFLQSTAPNQTSPGTNVTVFYNNYPSAGPDPQLIADMASGNAVYVEIKNAAGATNFNGIWQVTGIGTEMPPGHDTTHAYFTFTFTSSGNFYNRINGSTYQETIANLTMATPIPSLTAGTPITITGVSPQTGWNQTWTIVAAINSGAYNITSTSVDYATFTATYGWSFAGTTTTPPTPGSLITIINCTNNAVFNGTFQIATVSGSGSFFTVINFNAPAGITTQTETQAQATEFGTKFTFDPGEKYVGTTADVIYGNASNGNVAIIGSSLVPIGAGTRQAICFFITETGAWTPASQPVTFTVASNANELIVSSIPIGPPNVVGRGIAITEAGQNGVPGANFYVITQPVVNTVFGVTTTYTSTIINDNTSTTATFSFTDAVLLYSMEVDIPGNNLFNLIEIGSCAWCLPYASRMFYGLQLNKVNNFNNLTFDGGSLLQGWGQSPTLSPSEIQLVSSPVTGDALYISNPSNVIQPVMGMMSQTAYQDPYKVAIINANTAYSIRVACSCPSGVRLGTLMLDLTDLSGGIFGNTYGSFSVPLTDMVSNVTVFSGNLLSKGVFPGVVSVNLQLRVWVKDMGVGADVLVDRIEVFPTTFPYLKTEVYGSYINKPEAVDASGDGGIIDTSTENPQACMGGFVLRDSMYLLKTNSMYVTRDNPNSEPGGWSLNEISSIVGAVGINAYDSGDEWAVTACRSGIFGFSGAAPVRMTGEIYQVWDAINWAAGNTIVLRNDNVNRRIYCAVPLPTGTSPTGVPTASVAWLPYAPYNPTPTTPNVILMLNYQAVGTIEELFNVSEMHTTMFGTLAVQDMKRKWAIWNIATPYMGHVLRAQTDDRPIFFCNGNESSKIYQLDPTRHDDDGAAIFSLYCTYGFVNAAKAVTMPIFGMHTKRYTVLQVTTEGSGLETLKIYPNTLSARYPYKVPVGIKINTNAQDDYFRSINVKGNRAFIEVSTNAVGDWFALHKVLLTGKADPWSSLNPTGGGNAGIY